MIALLIALAIQSDWTGIRADGWEYQGTGSERNIMLFTRPAAQGGSMIWMRYEFSEDRLAHGRYRSMRALIEADCEGFRMRSLQTTSFVYSNLAGESIDAEPGEWFYAGPDTLHERILQLACGPAE